MYGPGKVAFGPFVVLADIHEEETLSRFGAALYVGNVGFLNFLFRLVNES
jgi:hypothetical protein